jgi:predicted nucleotidyltransferase
VLFEDVDKEQLDKLLPNKSLNKDIWKDSALKGSVRTALANIAEEFISFLGVEVTVKDIIFTGSLANYNYTDYSDIDLHVIIDFEEVDENLELVRDFMNAKKSLWNTRHDIMIYGHEVEMYAQDADEALHASDAGIFSIQQDLWINKPSHAVSYKDVDIKSVKRKVVKLQKKIDKITSAKYIDIDKLDTLKGKIKNMRQSGLERDGEFSVENLTFKVLRRTGYIQKIFDEKNKAFDSALSLNEINFRL